MKKILCIVAMFSFMAVIGCGDSTKPLGSGPNPANSGSPTPKTSGPKM